MALPSANVVVLGIVWIVRVLQNILVQAMASVKMTVHVLVLMKQIPIFILQGQRVNDVKNIGLVNRVIYDASLV
jgi:hypothetical protein